jgi:hypothetical protein
MLLSFPKGDAHPAEAICDGAARIEFVDLVLTRLPPSAFSSLVIGRKPA